MKKSISSSRSALAMTSAGAEAETLQQMQSVLFLPPQGSHDLGTGLTSRLSEVKGVTMKMSNHAWGRMGLPFRSDFIDLTRNQYRSGLKTMDFVGDADGSRRPNKEPVATNWEKGFGDDPKPRRGEPESSRRYPNLCPGARGAISL